MNRRQGSFAVILGLLYTVATTGLCVAMSLAIVFVSPGVLFAEVKAGSKAIASVPTPSIKNTTAVVKATKAKKTVTVQKTTRKKSRRTYVRSLLPQEKRAALRARGITSGFGMRAVHGGKRLHKGIDVSAPKGSKITAFNDGEVVFAGVKNGFGKMVIIRQIDGREALYAHMDSYVAKVGDQVRRGTHIGHVGRTGRATGCHVHFELIDEGEHLDPALHVWHGSELVFSPGDLDPEAPVQTHLAGTVKLNTH